MSRGGLRTTAACIWLCAVVACGGLRDPAGMGVEMLTMGTLRWGTGVSGRQPWIPAAFLSDTALWGVAGAGTLYYDRMDNLEDRRIGQGAVGAWGSLGPLTVKAACLYLDAWGIYAEQQGFLSLGVKGLQRIHLSAELHGFRIGLRQSDEKYEYLIHGGCTIWIPWSFASASLSCDRVELEGAAAAGFTVEPRVLLGLHTAPHRFGSQGVVFRFWEKDGLRTSFAVGHYYRVHPNVALAFSIATDPLLAAFGVSCTFAKTSFVAGVMHHPALGWSKGGMAELYNR